jgi:hypothetical protein
MTLFCIGKIFNVRNPWRFIRIFVDEIDIGVLVALGVYGLLPLWAENSVSMPPKMSDQKEMDSDGF